MHLNREQRGEKFHWKLMDKIFTRSERDRITRKATLLLNLSHSYSAIKSSAILVIVCYMLSIAANV